MPIILSFATHFWQEYLTGTPSCLTAVFMGEPSLKSFFLEPYAKTVMSKAVEGRAAVKGATVKA